VARRTALRGKTIAAGSRRQLIYLVNVDFIYLIRRSYDRNEEVLGRILAQMNQPFARESITDSQLFFYVRWGALAALGLVVIVLIWLLG
jgi:hypothetical protein